MAAVLYKTANTIDTYGRDWADTDHALKVVTAPARLKQQCTNCYLRRPLTVDAQTLRSCRSIALHALGLTLGHCAMVVPHSGFA